MEENFDLTKVFTVADSGNLFSGCKCVFAKDLADLGNILKSEELTKKSTFELTSILGKNRPDCFLADSGDTYPIVYALELKTQNITSVIKKHDFWVREKESGNNFLISAYNDKQVYVNGQWISYEDLDIKYTWTGGSPIKTVFNEHLWKKLSEAK